VKRRGFTLIEVLVALAVAAIGLGAALSVVTNATSNTVYLRDRVLASWLAANLITEMRLKPNLPEVTRTDGVTEYAGRNWKWEATVTQTQIEGLRRIDMEIREAGNEGGASLGHMTGFASRAGVAGSVGLSGDPFDPANGGGTPIPQVPATPSVPGQPTIRVK
jgi:general secretion pathway protein I